MSMATCGPIRGPRTRCPRRGAPAGACACRAVAGVAVEHQPRGKLRPARIVTHTLALKDAPHGYAIFDAKQDRAIKVMLRP